MANLFCIVIPPPLPSRYESVAMTTRENVVLPPLMGVWNARAQKGEGGTGNKLFQRLESLSDYTESKGWLEDKDE